LSFSIVNVAEDTESPYEIEQTESGDEEDSFFNYEGFFRQGIFINDANDLGTPHQKMFTSFNRFRIAGSIENENYKAERF